MKKYFLPSLKITLLTLVLFGVLYPLAITGIAKIIGPNGGEGKTIVIDNKVVGFLSPHGGGFNTAFFDGHAKYVRNPNINTDL